MFTKEEIKERFLKMQGNSLHYGVPLVEAELNLALLILACASFNKKLRSGEDYALHPLHVATSHTRSKNKRIIAILHDVVEDSDWTIEDLRELGFSERILKGVDGVTKRPGEKYFDFIVRCGQSGDDAIDVKINDLHHNMDPSRYRHVTDDPKHVLKQKAYNIAFHYLVDIKKYREDGHSHFNYPGISMADYLTHRQGFREHPEAVNQLLDVFSSETGRLPVPRQPQQKLPAATPA